MQQLGIAVRGVSTRSAIQTLAGVLHHVLTAAASSSRPPTWSSASACSVEAAVEREGTVVLPGRLLLDVVRSLPKDELTLEHRTAEQDVEVVSGASKFHLRTLPLDDFPKLPEAADAALMRVPAGAFVETIGRVARAASRDETRPHLTGVLVSASGQELRMVATDSYRLSVKETTLEKPVDGELEANVPARTLQELVARGHGGRPGGDRDHAAREPGHLQPGRCCDLVAARGGPLPELPPASAGVVRARAERERGGAARCGQADQPARAEERAAALRFTDGALEVSAQTPDVGEASECLPVPFKGEPLEIGFNPEFFRDGLESAESEELVLKLISPLRPGLLESGDDGGGFIYLVMPIRLNV